MKGLFMVLRFFVGVFLFFMLLVFLPSAVWAQDETAVSSDAVSLSDAIELHNAARNGDAAAAGKALAILDPLVASEPDNAIAMAYLGSAYTIVARFTGNAIDANGYMDKGLRSLGQAVEISPEDFVIRLIRVNAITDLPQTSQHQKTLREDMLALDKIYNEAPLPWQTALMKPVYEKLMEVAPGQEDWAGKLQSVEETKGED